MTPRGVRAHCPRMRPRAFTCTGTLKDLREAITRRRSTGQEGEGKIVSTRWDKAVPSVRITCYSPYYARTLIGPYVKSGKCVRKHFFPPRARRTGCLPYSASAADFVRIQLHEALHY